jgi:hypothetical protein
MPGFIAVSKNIYRDLFWILEAAWEKLPVSSKGTLC